MQVIPLSLSAIATLTLFLVPESPKYLHSKKDFIGAKRELAKIARYNGIKNYNIDFKFIEENYQ